MALPVLDGSRFRWKNRKGSSTLVELGLSEFPRKGFYIKSHKTGGLQLFLPDGETMEAQEFFDGEASAYFVPGGFITVQIWC